MNQNITINNANRVFFNLKLIIRIIKNVLKNMNKKNDFAMKQIKYQNFKFSKRAFINAFETNFKLMSEALKNNVKLIKSMMNKFFFYNRQFQQNQNQQHNFTLNLIQFQNFTYNSEE